MRLRLAALVAVAFTAGCAESTAPSDRAAATDAAQELMHVADSLSAHGGSPNEVGAYRSLADLLIGTGRISTVTISVDGAPAEFLATAHELQFVCPPGAACTTFAASPIDRSVIAWQKSNPRRVVQLFTRLPAIVSLGGAAPAPLEALPRLLFFDGAGALYGGNATSQSIDVTRSDTPCAPSSAFRPAIGDTATCTQAEFDVAFDGAATLIPLDGTYLQAGPTTSTSPAPEHRVTMAQQPVHGAHTDVAGINIEGPNPPGLTPPVTAPWRDSLSATLTTSVGSDVTLTFTVTNTRSTSASVQFNDSQQFDIRVWNDKDALVWRWGAGQGFAQMLTSRTLAAGESVTYTAHWAAPSAGTYRAMAYLTSSSHAAAAFTTFSQP